MKIVIVAQLVAATIVTLLFGLFMEWTTTPSSIYGASLGILITLLTKRSADKALRALEESPRYMFVAMYSGLVLRYALVILGLLSGFRVLQLAAIPMVSGFVLMILVLVVASPWARSGT